jgi:hypothetical protein
LVRVESIGSNYPLGTNSSNGSGYPQKILGDTPVILRIPITKILSRTLLKPLLTSTLFFVGSSFIIMWGTNRWAFINVGDALWWRLWPSASWSHGDILPELTPRPLAGENIYTRDHHTDLDHE